ncbi:FAD-dependent oxidoreductase [Oxalobacteraceae bacterium OM1]|nr:FAD-dependent oxidoreductase [Oxalobacteraceae bacterium OM1]
MTHLNESELDVLIIGAGQAGLAAAYALRQSGHTVALVDHHARVGDSWRQRYDSLVLFTPRRYSSLPGLALEGDPDGLPTKDEIADYLERYCVTHGFRVMSATRIVKLARRAGSFVAATSTGQTLHARAVVVATGPFQEPIVPAAAYFLPEQVEQWTVASYRNPAPFAGKRVLVVGDGASGRQIAHELVGTAFVTLATGKPRRLMRDRLLGKSIFWWLETLRLTRLSDQTRIGRRLQEADAFPAGKHLELPALQRHGVLVTGRLSSFAGNEAAFSDGVTVRVDAVIWAVGYRENSNWITIPEAKGRDGAIVSDRGHSPVPGLYYVGRNWQTSRGSSLLLGVARDASQMALAVQRHLGCAAHTAESLASAAPGIPAASHPGSFEPQL